MSEKGGEFNPNMKQEGRKIVVGLNVDEQNERWHKIGEKVQEELDYANSWHPDVNQVKVQGGNESPADALLSKASQERPKNYGDVDEVANGFKPYEGPYQPVMQQERPPKGSLEDRMLAGKGNFDDTEVYPYEQNKRPDVNTPVYQGPSEEDWAKVKGYHEQGHDQVVTVEHKKKGTTENVYLEGLLEKWAQADEIVQSIPKGTEDPEEHVKRYNARQQRNKVERRMDQALGISREEGDKRRQEYLQRKAEEEQLKNQPPEIKIISEESLGGSAPQEAEMRDMRMEEFIRLNRLNTGARTPEINDRIGELGRELKNDLGDEFDNRLRDTTRRMKEAEAAEAEKEESLNGEIPTDDRPEDENNGDEVPIDNRPEDEDGNDSGSIPIDNRPEDDQGSQPGGEPVIVGGPFDNLDDNNREENNLFNNVHIVGGEPIGTSPESQGGFDIDLDQSAESVANDLRPEPERRTGLGGLIDRAREAGRNLRDRIRRNNNRDNRQTVERAVNRVEANTQSGLRHFLESWNTFWSPEKQKIQQEVEGKLIRTLMSGSTLPDNERFEPDLDIITERLNHHIDGLGDIDMIGIRLDEAIQGAVAHTELIEQLIEQRLRNDLPRRIDLLESQRRFDDQRLSEQRS